MFLYTLAGTLVNQTNAFMFGLFVPSQTVGVFAGAEKIIRAICALVGPFSAALHAKINYRIGSDRRGAARLLVAGMGALLALAVLVAVLVWFMSDRLAAMLLGPDFRESARPLRMLCILPVIHWMSYSLSLNWFIVQRMDRAVNACVIAAALVTVVSTCVLVPLFSVTGITVCVILSETAFLAALIIALVRKRQNLLTIAFPRSDKAENEMGAR
jgi:O-antigen/teichoic acid export membrane protein